MRLRCLIVDDNAPFLRAARTLLERQGMTVVGVATSAAEALRRAHELTPDVILVDVDLGADSGFELARRLADGPFSTAAILISARRQEDLQDLVAESGALGFVGKAHLSREAIEALLERSELA